MSSQTPDFIGHVAWLSTPKALIEIDRELVKRGGFRAFVELAWHIIEPAAPFSPNWHIDVMCAELEAVAAGQNLRLAMAIPPRHGKSSILAVFFPVYVWMQYPAKRMMFISYDFSLSLRDSDRTRELIQSDWFQQRWGEKFQLRNDNVTILKTNKTGYRECGSVGGRIMGKGADIIVADDPHDSKDVESEAKRREVLKYWRERLQSRLNDPKTGAFIVCHQRVGVDDIIGDILKRQPGEYRYLCIAAKFDLKHPHIWPGDPRTEAGQLLWPVHMPMYVIDRFKVNLGDYAFAAQFQQLPGPREGGLFKSHWFPTIRKEQLPGDIQWCRGWDFAATIASQIKSDPDYTATVLIGHSRTNQKYYIGHADRWRIDTGEVDRKVKFYAEEDTKQFPGRIRIRMPQDPGAAGKGRAQQQGMLLSGYSFLIEPVTGDKAVNAAPLAGQASIGNVFMVEAPWNADFVSEFTSFPTGSHDDQIDAASSAFKGFLKSNVGILDYYTKMLEEDKAKNEERRSAGDSGFGHYTDQTTDMGNGLSNKMP